MDKNLKICVYAICKNESKFVDRWIASLKDEADYVVVLDTGSTDDTVEKLQKYRPFVKVRRFDYKSELGYFRFDKARNDSLKLVPYDADICVVFDLDHVPRTEWSDIIRRGFMDGCKEITGLIIDHDQDGNELNQWMSRNVHPNSPLWIWEKVIHEGIQYHGEEQYETLFDPNFIIDHFPDNNKDRSLYKELLYYSCKEYPEDPYYGIYLGIELSRRGTKEEAIRAFKRCLDECDFTDNEDIEYQCCLNIASITDDDDEAIYFLNQASEMGFKTRRAFSLYADIFERQELYDDAINALERALLVQSNSNDWKDDAELFNGAIEDRLSLFYYYQKQNYLKAIEYCVKSLNYKPDDERINNNLSFYYNKYIESRGM